MNKPIALSLLCAALMGVSARAQTQDTQPSLYLRGWICDTAKKSLADVTVKIVEDKSPATTDSNGKYAIGPLNAGKYTVIVRKEGYLSFVEKDIVVSAANGFYKHNFILHTGTDMEPESLLVPKYGTVSGIIRSKKTKKPLHRAYVHIDGMRLFVRSREDGGFIIPNIPVGFYTVVIDYYECKTAIYKKVPITSHGNIVLNAYLEEEDLSRTIKVIQPMVIPDQTGSMRVLSGEEIRKHPGH